jgi:hypothetical protein
MRSYNSLLSHTSFGVGKDLFVKLLEYCKTIDAEGFAFYSKEYDNDDEFTQNKFGQSQGNAQSQVNPPERIRLFAGRFVFYYHLLP